MDLVGPPLKVIVARFASHERVAFDLRQDSALYDHVLVFAF